MFERFTDRARRVLVLAQEEAGNQGRDYLGTEHILAGLVLEASGVGGRVLSDLGLTIDLVREGIDRRITPVPVGNAEALATIGIDLDAVRRKVEETFGEGALQLPEPPPPAFTPKGKRVLELAFEESQKLLHNYIGTEHILLGLLEMDAAALAMQILTERAPADAIRGRVHEMLGAYNLPDDRPELSPDMVVALGMFADHVGYLTPIRDAYTGGAPVLVSIKTADEGWSATVSSLKGLAVGLSAELVHLAPGVYLLKDATTKLTPAIRDALLGLVGPQPFA